MGHVEAGEAVQVCRGQIIKTFVCVFLEKVSILMNNLETESAYGNHIKSKDKGSTR